jgi:phage repressor protein C with HTH and peptisase S24 domain
MTQADLADAIGAAQPTVSDWLGEKKTPSTRYARAVLDELALGWDDVVESLEQGRGAVRRSAPRKEDLDAADVVLIPRLGHAGASDAGVLNGSEAPAYDAYTRYQIRRLTQENPDRLRSCTVTGDSMEPVLRANDSVVYLPVEEFGDAGIYVFRLDGAHLVKLVQRLGGGALDVIPYNEERYSRERFIPIPYPDEADTPNTYRSELTDLTSTIEPVGKVVFYPRPA